MSKRTDVIRTGGIAAAVAAFALLAGRSAQADGELELGGLRLVTLQADIEPGDNAGNGLDAVDIDPDDGGWDWSTTIAATEHTASASPTNTYGVTAMGALRAFVRGTPDPRFFRAALIAEQKMDEFAMNRNPDFAFRLFLSKLAMDPSFAETAKTLWIAKMNSFGGAQGYGEFVRDTRASQGIGAIYPWDIMWAVVSATFLDKRYPGEGFRSDALALAFVIFADTQSVSPIFLINDHTQDFHSIGLTGLVISFRMARQYDAVRDEAYGVLLANQNLDGGFNWNATYTDSDAQVTAYAVLAASVLKSDPRSLPAAQAGSDWMATLQQPNGGFDNYGDGTDNTEVDSEILVAFSRIAPASSFTRGSGVPRSSKRPPAFATAIAD